MEKFHFFQIFNCISLNHRDNLKNACFLKSTWPKFLKGMRKKRSNIFGFILARAELKNFPQLALCIEMRERATKYLPVLLK